MAKKPTRCSILELTAQEASAFFLKPENYCSLDLPEYVDFEPVLTATDTFLQSHPLNTVSRKPRDIENVNHIIVSNKDGKYAWRPIQLIHPALYVALVKKITETKHWKHITDRFKEFSKSKKIQCASIPVVPLGNQKSKAEQIIEWWSSVEQQTFELSLDFEYMIETDLADCYGSIYTHSVAWALHGINDAKASATDKKTYKTLVGNLIDEHIKDMRYGQTNGIPQGSVLMDFIAEMVLGYADSELSQRLKNDTIRPKDYHILRYRDDYRIFVNDSQVGDRIVKLLTETMIGLGLKLNPTKTRTTDDIVHSAMKPDKICWLHKSLSGLPHYKALMVIHEHAKQFPNSGSLVKILLEFFKTIEQTKKFTAPLPLIGIVVDIAYRNPKTYPLCAAIISTLVKSLNKTDAKCIVRKIHKKFERIPNTGYMEIWLQRAVLPSSVDVIYNEKICSLVTTKVKIDPLWDTTWISAPALKTAILTSIIDQDKLDACRKKTISSNEVELFVSKNAVVS